ncbi:MAG: type II toxin-antitoxin system Phd/YefM family antitoxin [Proteobacteria bacterium]|nr:type II toxin-antitoxin system Phd/YefM family antitoxin [Pseudomonadota bacterium]
MLNLDDIHPLTDFLRNTKTYGRRLKKTGRPTVLTVNGEAEFVVLHPLSYQRLAAKAARRNDYAALDRSIADMKAGRVRPADDVLDELETLSLKEIKRKSSKKK